MFCLKYIIVNFKGGSSIVEQNNNKNNKNYLWQGYTLQGTWWHRKVWVWYLRESVLSDGKRTTLDRWKIPGLVNSTCDIQKEAETILI